MQIALETWESISEKDFNKLFKEFQVIKLKINQYQQKINKYIH